MSKLTLTLVMFIGLILSTSHSQACAQAPSKNSKSSQPTDRSKSFEARFWQYLLSNNYENWAPPAGQGGDFFQGTSAHGQRHMLYLNRTAASNPDTLPDESVVVMENYRGNGTLESISVMLRSAGSNPSQQDWYWITYGPDGSVIGSAKENTSDQPVERKPSSAFVSTAGATVLGSSCTQCHQNAPGDDFVYFNSDHEKLDDASFESLKLVR